MLSYKSITFLESVAMELKLRDIREDDCELLFKWANDKDVRKNALDTASISWDEHVLWFNKKITDTESVIFILEKGNLPIGQIRYDKIERFWNLDFSIVRDCRGMGLGKKIIKLSLDKISGSIRALVKKENIASCKVFERLGFQKTVYEDYIQYIYLK